MTKAITTRQLEALRTMARICDTGMYWIPGWNDNEYWSGAGDASAIKALWRRGLAEQVTSDQCAIPKYASRITEEGRKQIKEMDK